MAGMMTTRCGAAQMGYNLLYGLWKYAWDADCELFLKILEGETKEDVYVQQVQLQVPILNCLPACLPACLSFRRHDRAATQWCPALARHLGGSCTRL